MYYDKYIKYKNKYNNLKRQNNNYKNLIEISKKEILPVFVYVKDIKYKLDYIPHFREFITNLHYGQRKLFLNELQFLTKYCSLLNKKLDNYQTEYVIYAGAAPNNHIYFLYQLVPNIKFILIDPSPFNIFIKNPNINHLNTKNDDICYIRYGEKIQKELRDYQILNFYDPVTNKVVNYDKIPLNPELGSFSYYDENSEQIINFIKTSNYKIFIFQDFYTNELSELFRGLNKSKIYFFSDIRTQLVSTADSPDDLDVLWNLSQQFNWVKILKPDAFMLKYRCPYFSDFKNKTETEINEYVNNNFDDSFKISKKYGIDFIKNYVNRKVMYLSGEYYIQPWAPITSTEIRVVGDNINKFSFYDCFDAEKKFTYFNNIDRTFVRHNNKYVDKEIGFDCCNDCSLEALIWEDYIEKYPYKNNLNVIDMVKKLTIVLGKSLKRNGHGNLFDEPTKEWYDNLKKIYYKK